MYGKYQLKFLQCMIGIGVLIACFANAACVNQVGAKKNHYRPNEKVAEKNQGEKEGNEQFPNDPLPTVNQLIEAKLSALKKKQSEQEEVIALAEHELLKEQGNEKKIFDNNAYLSISMINSAPEADYELEHTKIYVDGKLLAQGGKRNHGLPRKTEIFFGPVEPGCHDLLVKTKYIRLKNDVISRFKVDRIEMVSRRQAFIAKDGYKVEIGIEGYEAHNTFLNLYRGPAVRFNKLIRPNVVLGGTLVSLNEIFNEGRVHIDYITEDTSHHRLIEKSVSIDGLPVLVKAKHDVAKEKDVVFDAPLTQGKHTLGVTLVFGEKKWIGGGPLYNFELQFDRDFYVIGGQTTVINLLGMPSDGFRSREQDSRYARATSKILSTENEEFFPEHTCKEIAAKEQALMKQTLVKESTMVGE